MHGHIRFVIKFIFSLLLNLYLESIDMHFFSWETLVPSKTSWCWGVH